jgi:hypothetical protein
MNQGKDWTTISPDLTQGGKAGNVAYGTITSISESTFQFGLIYTGSDDGLVQVTKDSGASWESLNGGWPANLWVSRVVASQHKKGRVYVTLNGYRFDDFTPYVFMSDDYGKTWSNIGTSIPTAAVNVIIEHPKKENILFVGTDNATYVSINTGKTWDLLTGGMPPVAVHDLKIQPVENHLLVGTHGRSIYVGDLTALGLVGNKFAFAKVNKTRSSTRHGNKRPLSSDIPEPVIKLSFYSPTTGIATIEVFNEMGKVLQELSTSVDTGLNFYTYNGSINAAGLKRFKETPKTADNGESYLPKGTYTIKISSAMGGGAQELIVE